MQTTDRPDGYAFNERLLSSGLTHLDLRQGYLNICEVVREKESGRLLVIRTPKPESERLLTHELIHNDFLHSGAYAAGLNFRLRSPAEQGIFIKTALDLGLRVIPYEVANEQYLVLPFIEGMLLSDVVASSSQAFAVTAVRGALDGLAQAHERGIIFGDRWCPNTVVTPEGGCFEFDFDIEILGDKKIAATFEIAQTVYHTIHFAQLRRDEFIKVIGSWLAGSYHNRSDELSKVVGFIQGFTHYYRELFDTKGALLENIEPISSDEVNELVAQLPEYFKGDL